MNLGGTTPRRPIVLGCLFIYLKERGNVNELQGYTASSKNGL